MRLQKGDLINIWLVISFSETKNNRNRFGEKVRVCLGPIKSEVPTDFLGDFRWAGNRRSVKCSDRTVTHLLALLQWCMFMRKH